MLCVCHEFQYRNINHSLYKKCQEINWWKLSSAFISPHKYTENSVDIFIRTQQIQRANEGDDDSDALIFSHLSQNKCYSHTSTHIHTHRHRLDTVYFIILRRWTLWKMGKSMCYGLFLWRIENANGRDIRIYMCSDGEAVSGRMHTANECL